MKKLLYFSLLLFMGIGCTPKGTQEEKEGLEGTFVYVDLDSIETNSAYIDSIIWEGKVAEVAMYGDTAIAKYVWEHGRPDTMQYMVMSREEAIEWLNRGKNKRK